jgi:hypothetical protein
MRDDTVTCRDDELGALLRELDLPEHRPEFHAELHRRLAEERGRRAARARRRRLVRRGYARWGVRAALVTAAGALAFVVLDVVRSGDGPGSRIQIVEPASAAEIKRQVRTALASADNLSGELVVRGRSYENAYGWDRPMRWRFTITARGDFRLTGVTLRENIAYDASRGVERSLNPSASIGGKTLFAAVRRGIAPGPPDPGPSSSILQKDFASFVRALLAADDPRVREVTYRGRPAWRLDVAAVPNAIVPQLSGDHFAIWVDRETGIPVRVVESKAGVVLDELRIERLAVDTELPPDSFTIRFPPGAEVMREDQGFRRVGVAEVKRIVGYAPLVPRWTPEGYELTEVAVARRSGYPTGVEGANPPSTGIVSLSYRRGLDQFIVTTRVSRVPAPGEPQLPLSELWSDPLGTGEGYVDRPERVRARRGALSGVELNLLLVPRNIPHVWALTDELVVTVSGDLSRAELLRVAESLRERP